MTFLYERKSQHWSDSYDRAGLLEVLSIPPLFSQALIEDFKPGDVSAWSGGRFNELSTEDLVRLVKKGPQNVFITGNNGRGKSHLASCLAFEWAAFWNRTSEFLRAIRSSFRGKGKSEEKIFDMWLEREVIVVDDITVTAATEFSAGSINDLVNLRIEYERPTIVTSYSSLGEIQMQFDRSLASRLRSFIYLKCEGADRRAR